MNVTLIAAQSLDGYITFHEKPGSEFTSDADKLYFREALRAFDCRVMGSETYRVTRDTTRRAAQAGAEITVSTREPENFSTEIVPGKLLFTAQSPTDLVQTLAQKGHKRCALLGGARTHSRFLAEGCVDEIWLTIEPRLFGSGTRLLTESTDEKLELNSSESLSQNTLLLKYRVVRTPRRT